MIVKNSHLLSVDQISSLDTVDRICDLARRLEIAVAEQKALTILENFILLNVFFEASTRTRLSFASAFKRLGGTTIDVIEQGTTSLVKGESFYDTARVMSAYGDIIVLRHVQTAALLEFADAAQVPVINAGSGVGEHPTQALLDVYTLLKELRINRLGELETLTICLAGDLKHGRTVHSLSQLLALLGKKITFKLVAPVPLMMPAAIVNKLKQQHSLVFETQDLRAGVANADVIYMTRIQQERFATAQEFTQYAGSYVIDKQFYHRYCPQHTLLMHPLPRDARFARPEIDPDLNDHPNLAIFRQAQNGVAVRMALFCLLLGIDPQSPFQA